MLHHVELWVPDLERGKAQWGWLLGELGYRQFQDWPAGRSWRLGATYLVIEQSPAMSVAEHDRLRPGLNHLAFHAGTRERVDALTTSGPMHGWALLFGDKHPHAGGEDHYADGDLKGAASRDDRRLPMVRRVWRPMRANAESPVHRRGCQTGLRGRHRRA